MDLIGKNIGNRYQIMEKLGGGGMAVVYRARCCYLQRDVTIKVLRPEYYGDEDFVERFRREAQAVASLSHPNIVNVYDVGQEDNIHYIVMEYVEGKNLKEVIRERGPLPIEEAVDIARQICEGLDHAHEHKIVHRDIKPHNILITKTGRVKVTDFGIARAATAATVTQTGTIVGSVHYFSPEQAKGDGTGHRSDIYSVGVVLYEMLTGSLPFEGDTPISIILKQVQADPEPPSKLNPAVTPELEKVVLRAMAKNADYRYQTAGEMAQDLKTVLSGKIGEATRNIDEEFATRVLPISTLDLKPRVIRADKDEPKEEKKDRRWLWAVVAVLLLGLFGGGFVAYMQGSEVTMPNVVGMPKDEAQRTLEQAGLKMVVEREEYSSDYQAGTVTWQSETPRKTIKEGREIKVVLSKGEQRIKVPALKGQDRERAAVTLDNTGLIQGTVNEEYSDEVSEGYVTRQEPEADNEVSKGSAVNIWLSKGPEPKKIMVPDVLRLSTDDAINKLKANGLKVDENFTYESSNTEFEGTVIDQDPDANIEVREGSTIKLKVSQGPGPGEKKATFNIPLSPDGQVHTLTAMVYDSKDPSGRKEREGQYQGGETVALEVTYYGTGQVQFLVDGKPYGEKQPLQ
ncbi:MAG: Stk1 family PASTA domain-containing Ser/Thr kinase [Thermincolia bacterium]